MAGQHPHHPLRAVIGADDLNNAYIDGSQKCLVSRGVKLEPHFTVLNYGCGVGRWTLWFARRVKHVAGVDISPKMVAAARQAADEAGIRNAEHTVIGGLPLPFEDGAFDLVNAVWALRYIIDDDELAHTVSELCRVTRPGGISPSSRCSRGESRSSRSARVSSAEWRCTGEGEITSRSLRGAA